MDKRKKELLKISDEIKKLIDDKQKELSLTFRRYAHLSYKKA